MLRFLHGYIEKYIRKNFHGLYYNDDNKMISIENIEKDTIDDDEYVYIKDSFII